MATLKLAIPMSRGPQYFSIKVADGFFNRRGCISSNCRLTVYTTIAGKTTNTTIVKYRNYFQICHGMMCKI